VLKFRSLVLINSRKKKERRRRRKKTSGTNVYLFLLLFLSWFCSLTDNLSTYLYKGIERKKNVQVMLLDISYV